MITKENCRNCAFACDLEIEHDELAIIRVKGNNCLRGASYAEEILKLPYRFVNASVKVNNGKYGRVSIRCVRPVSREIYGKVLSELKNLEIEAPVKEGDKVILNFMEQGIDFYAVSEVPLK
jgi:CxxC motif-containing protein